MENQNLDPQSEPMQPEMIVPDFSLQGGNPLPSQPAPKTQQNPSSPPTPPIQSNGVNSSWLSRLFKSKWTYIIAGIIVLILIGLFVFAFVVYGMGKTSMGEKFQNKIWTAFITESMDETQNFNFNLTYTDKGTYNFKPSNFTSQLGVIDEAEQKDMDDKYSFTIADDSLSTNLNGYLNLADKDKPQTDAHGDLTISNNSKDYSVNSDFKLLEKEAYLKYGYNDNVQKLIDDTFGISEPDKYKEKWIQSTESADIDSARDELKSFVKNSSDSDSSKLLQKYRLFDIKMLKGITFMDGHAVVHYSLQLNKNKLEDYVNATIDKEDYVSSDEKKQAKEYAKSIDDKIQMKNFDIWVGLTNHKVYKTDITLNAISVVKTLQAIEDALKKPGVLNAKDNMDNARSKSRDAKRLADARQIASALELYYDDNHNSYPAAENGKPVGIAPTYLAEYPTAPKPADGDCTDYYNTYWYTQISPSSYKLEFCLGSATGGIKAGEVTMTENGFQGLSNEIQTEETPGPDTNAIIKEVIKTINFDAELKISYKFENVGKVQAIDAPTDFIKQSDMKAEEQHQNSSIPEAFPMADQLKSFARQF